jgi:hypothetical protein
MRLHEVLCIAVGRQPDQGIALLMFDEIGVHTQEHFGIANAGRFNDINLANIVIAHSIHDRPLKRQGLPAPFLVCGLFGKVIVIISPFYRCLRFRSVQ